MLIKDKIDSIIRTVPDFPKQGVSFKDITSLLLDAELSSSIVESFVEILQKKRIDAIVGVESRGFLFGFLLANKLKIPFVPIRKAGKLPGEIVAYSYDLEYGSSEVEIHRSDIKRGWNVLIHDDLLATGGTASAASELVALLGANVIGFAFVISLDYLNGRKKLEKYSDNIISLKSY